MGLIVDGYDVANIGVQIREGLDGWKDGFGDASGTQTLPLRPGGKFTSASRQQNMRQVTIPLYVEGSTQSEAKSRLDELKFRLHNVPTTLELPDESREFTGRLSSLSTSGAQSDLSTVGYTIEASFQLPDPRLYETSTTSVDFSGGVTQTSLGTAIVHPTITVEEVSAPYTVTYKDSDGNVIASITLDTTLAAGEQRIIDMEDQTIEDGSGNNAISEKSGGEFFGLDPHDGVYGGPYPTLEIDSTATVAKAEYQKAYI